MNLDMRKIVVKHSKSVTSYVEDDLNGIYTEMLSCSKNFKLYFLRQQISESAVKLLKTFRIINKYGTSEVWNSMQKKNDCLL